MNIKNVLKKMNNQNGLTGADVAIAVSILVITVVVVTMIYLNLDVNNKNVKRTAGATRIATNILETIQLANFDSVESKTITNGNKLEYTVTDYYNNGNTKTYSTKVPNGYTAQINVEQKDSKAQLVKNVNVDVSYKVGDNVKTVSLSTVIEKKLIKECNAPDISNEFLSSSSDEETKKLNEKYIVPIKYSYLLDKYVVTTTKDSEWYNYSSKEWAKIIVVDDKTFFENNLLDTIDNSIKTTKFSVSGTDKTYKDYLYVWIPNFGKEASTGKIYFRYGSASKDASGAVLKNAITLSKKEVGTDKFNFYEIDSSKNIDSSIELTSTGLWRKYNSAPSQREAYGILNSSVYGPVMIHDI